MAVGSTIRDFCVKLRLSYGNNNCKALLLVTLGFRKPSVFEL